MKIKAKEAKRQYDNYTFARWLFMRSWMSFVDWLKFRDYEVEE